VIDQNCRARLADFGLLTVITNSMKLFSSSATEKNGGTLRWMSPELIAPEKFGFKTSRPTRSSDCYSLGMVAYEAFSGNIPFHQIHDMGVFLKVVEGGRPSRVVGFTDNLWKMVEQCWMPHPDHRPNIEDVLQFFEMCSTGENLGSDSLSVSGGTPPTVPLDNHSVDGVSWFSPCPSPCLIIPHLCRSSSPYGTGHRNWLPERLTQSPYRLCF
jgi:serine/threonine protein kinase